MIAVTEDMLKEITRKIVDAVHPVKIILFGSYARGDYGAHSDIDLIVVEDEPFGQGRSRRAVSSKIWQALRRVQFPVDILVFSRKEIEEWSTTINHIIARATREGKVIYERS